MKKIKTNSVSNFIINESITFLKRMRTYCDKRGVESKLSVFINLKSNPDNYISDTYAFLQNAPTTLLLSSRSFRIYFNQLDNDFKNDLIEQSHGQSSKLIVKHDKWLQKFYRKILKDDYLPV